MTTSSNPVEEVAKMTMLSLGEAASISGVSVSTLKRENKLERLKITKMSARRVGVRIDHFRQWLDSKVA